MKRILTLLILVFASVLLIACGDSGYTEVEMTSDEIIELLSGLEITVEDSNIKQQLDFVLKGSYEMEVEGYSWDPITYEPIYEVYTNGFDVDIDITAYTGFGETLEEFLFYLNIKKLELEISESNETIAISANNNKLFHGGNGRFYGDLNIAMSQGGFSSTIEGKYKSEVIITQEDFAELLEGLNVAEVPAEILDIDFNELFEEIDFDQLIEMTNLKVAKKGDSYKLTMSIERDMIIEALVYSVFGFVGFDDPESQEMFEMIIEMIGSAVQEFEVDFELVIDNNAVTSMSLEAKMDIDTSLLEDREEMEIPLFSFKIDTFKVSVKTITSNVVVPTDLETYTKDFSELDELFS